MKLMKFKVLTIFPDMFTGFLESSIIGRGIGKELIDVELIDIRDYSENKHNKVDDMPFGGGPGMVMTPQPIIDAIEKNKGSKAKVIFLTPKGQKLEQKKINELSKEEELIILCGHYEGIDQRVIDNYVDEEISIGDFVLTGGELGAMILIDSIGRLLPGVIGDQGSFINDSHYNGLLDHPHYTRPREYKGLEVPEVLLNGNHKKIDEWRFEKSVENTYFKRPDMIEKLLGGNHSKLEKIKKMIKNLKKI